MKNTVLSKEIKQKFTFSKNIKAERNIYLKSEQEMITYSRFS